MGAFGGENINGFRIKVEIEVGLSVAVRRDGLDAVSSLGIPSALGCWRWKRVFLGLERGVLLTSVCWEAQEKSYRANWTYGALQYD